MEENNSDLTKAFNPDLWFAFGYFTAIIVMYLTEKIAKYLSSEAVVYTMPPSQNGNASSIGETVITLEKETADNE